MHLLRNHCSSSVKKFYSYHHTIQANSASYTQLDGKWIPTKWQWHALTGKVTGGLVGITLTTPLHQTLWYIHLVSVQVSYVAASIRPPPRFQLRSPWLSITLSVYKNNLWPRDVKQPMNAAKNNTVLCLSFFKHTQWRPVDDVDYCPCLPRRRDIYSIFSRIYNDHNQTVFAEVTVDHLNENFLNADSEMLMYPCKVRPEANAPIFPVLPWSLRKLIGSLIQLKQTYKESAIDWGLT